MRGLLTELKVFMFIVFVLFGSICGGNNAEFPSDQETTIKRLTDDVRPSSYIIRLNSTLYPVFISNGEVLIDLTVKSSVENITLHARKLDVISVMILEKHRFKKYKIDRSDPSNVLDIVRKAGDIKSFTIENDLLEIPARSGRELGGGYFKAGDYLLYARFNAMIGDLAQGYGLYRDSYEDGNRTRWLMSTVFETSRARTAFPCFDEPSFKSRFKIILARTRDQVALANMPSLKSYPMDGTDLMWEEFEETPPMSTYLVAFFVGDFTSWTGRRGDVTVWTSPATDRTLVDWSLEEGFKALYHMQNIFDLDNPLPKTDLLAVPHFDVAGAVENWGLITIREDILTLSNNTGQALRRRMTILAHELAHTWFGNSVTPSWWDEVWWSEGFASYYATRIVQKLKPDWDVIGWDSVDFLSETWKLDSKPEVRYLAKPVEAYNELNFGNLVYCKGFLVARFAGWITQRAATFDKAVGKYLKENQFGLFNDRKMWRTIEEAVLAKNNSIMDLPAPLATIMRSWTHQAGMPLIKVLRSSSGQIVITQERYAEKMKTGNETKSRKIGEKWWIPIEIEFGDHSEVNLVLETSGLSNESQYSKEKRAALPTSDKQIYWMNPLDEKLEIRDHDHDHSSWVLINLNVPVPCRVMYDEWNLQMLTRNDYKRFTTVGLAQMIADASALAMHGEYRLPLALQMIRDVLQTTDSFAVWRIGLVNLHKFEYQLKGTDAYQLYQQFIQQLIGWQFGRLKILSESRDRGMTMNDELLRFEVAETACNARLRACLIEANNIFRKWIDSSLSKPDSQNFIRHDVRTTVYCTAIELGGEREWQFLWDQLQGKRSNIDQEERRRILDALACSKNQQLLKRYLESSLQTNTTDNLRNFKERRAVFYSVLKNVDAVDLLMDFMHENKDEMKRVYSRSEKRFNWKRAVALLATFVSTNHITKLEKLTRNSQILNKARKMIMWRSENSKEAAEWLRRVVV